MKLCQSGHAARGLRADHPGATRGQRLGVLADPAAHVEDAPPGRGKRGAEGPFGHSGEQELAVGRRTRRNHIAHVPVEIDYTHGAQS